MRWNPTKEEHYYQILRVLEPWIPKNQLEAWIYEVVQKFKRRDRVQYILMQVRMKAVLKLLAKLPRDPQNKSVKKLQALYWKFLDAYAISDQPLWEEETSLASGRSVRNAVYAPKFPNRLSPAEEETLWSKLQSDYEEIEHLMDTMDTGHYQTALDIIWAYQPINCINVVGYNPQITILISQLQEAIEKDRSEIETKFILPEDMPIYAGALFVQCDDNYAWYALLTPGQRQTEARLMNHCATPQRGIILSLREFVPQYGLRPHLTFEYILDCDPPTNPEDFNYFFKNTAGILGEMKGYGNSKPTPQYHAAILCLLALPNILGVAGGSYLSDHDFSLADLSKPDRAKLTKLRPDLFDDRLLITQKPQALSSWLKKYFPRVIIKDDKLIDRRFDDNIEGFQYILSENLLSDCYSSSVDVGEHLRRLVHFLENPGDFDFWIEKYGHRELSHFLEGMQATKYQKYYQKFIPILHGGIQKLVGPDPVLASEIINHIEDEEWDEIPEEIFDVLKSAARIAESFGWESGTLDAMAKELNEIFPLETKRGTITNNGIITTPGRIFETLTKEEENNNLPNEECYRVRKIVWRASEVQDFDEEVAFENFLDRLHEDF